MYSPHSYGSPPAELSNNPFIDHPANALTRYPDITGSDSPVDSSGQYTSWLPQQPGSNATGSLNGYPGQSYSNGYGGGYQPQSPQQTNYGGSGFMQSPQTYGAAPVQSPMITGRSGFQPSSSFGQQLAAHVNGAYTSGMPQQQPQTTGYLSQTPSQFSNAYQPQQGYGQQPQQYLAEFDPYSQLGQSQSAVGASPAPGGSQYRPPHPREYVQAHKSELEAWDIYAWKQMQNSLDALKESWGARKREIEARARSLGGAGLFGGGGYTGMYGGQAQEAMRLENLVKEADTHHDSIAASAFQMQEVFSGYRQSGDLASKRRVREAINAALANLPDWPPQTF